VQRVEPCDPGLVTATLEELASDMKIAGVHIGMLGSSQVAKAIVDFLRRKKLPAVVLDPILRASSGADLLDRDGTGILISDLLPLATVVTPNVEEAAVLTGLQVTNPDQMRSAAIKLHEMGAESVVVTGGHLEKAVDLLSFQTRRGVEQEVFKSERQRSNSTHGTGCAFATAMACHLALDRGLPEAVLLAKAYVSAAISKGHPLGRGAGPVHHLYRMQQQRRAGTVVTEPEPVH